VSIIAAADDSRKAIADPAPQPWNSENPKVETSPFWQRFSI
jgi:hypothetical protein